MKEQETRPMIPEGYSIDEMGADWFIPRKWDARKHMWRPFDKGANGYYWHKTWNGAYRFLMRKIAEKQAREQE